MLETFGIKDEYLFKVAVIATMSSGKSTFINALVGKDLLLSRNEACSARVISILDNDQNKEEKVYVEYADGSFEKGRDLTQEYMEVINSDERIDKVLIETHIDGIKNTDRAMVIIDTPGVNNSMDNSHREKTMELIHRLDEGLIIYLLNATQLGVEDDQSFLLEIAELVNESNDQLKIMFAINKIDEVDEEKESIAQVMENAHAYLVNAGIKNPQIYPVSSLACKLFRRGINEESFSRKEMSDFRRFYNTFAPRGFDPSRYIVADEYDQRNKKVTVGKEEFLCRDL
ncbi:MAG: dynamin family protein, partial [Lachnospiraceae bacterium]|nr:dynamin family protein [Lachnospiraceae bacterium]